MVVKYFVLHFCCAQLFLGPLFSGPYFRPLFCCAPILCAPFLYALHFSLCSILLCSILFVLNYGLSVSTFDQFCWFFRSLFKLFGLLYYFLSSIKIMLRSTIYPNNRSKYKQEKIETKIRATTTQLELKPKMGSDSFKQQKLTAQDPTKTITKKLLPGAGESGHQMPDFRLVGFDNGGPKFLVNWKP